MMYTSLMPSNSNILLETKIQFKNIQSRKKHFKLIRVISQKKYYLKSLARTMVKNRSISHKKDRILADVCSKKTVYAHIFHGYTVNDVTLKDLN